MIKELIYSHFETERLYKESKDMDINKEYNLAPSSLHECLRKLYYKKTNTPSSNPTSLHAYIKFSLGHAIHEKLADIISRVAYLKKGETRNEKELYGVKWIYYLDNTIIVQFKEFILEIKTIYGNKSYNDLPKDDHILQLFAYLLLEEKENGILLYICRDTGFIEEFHFIIDILKEKYGEKFKDRLRKLKELKNNIDNKIEPEREYQLYLKNRDGIIVDSFQKDKVNYTTPWQCRKDNGNTYCPYRDLCWQKELEKIKNYRFYIDGNFIN